MKIGLSPRTLRCLRAAARPGTRSTGSSSARPRRAGRAQAAPGASAPRPARNPRGVRSKLRPLLLLPGAAPHRPSLPWEGFSISPYARSPTTSEPPGPPRLPPSAAGTRGSTCRGLAAEPKPPGSRRLARCSRRRLQQLRARRVLPGSAPLPRPTPKNHLAQAPTVMLLPLTFNPGPKKSDGVKPGNKPHCPQPTNASLRKICY